MKYRIAAILALLAAPAFASDEKGLYQTLNLVSCQQFTEDRKLPLHTGRNAADEIYISGWLSAFNYLTPNTYEIVPGHDIMKVLEWLDGYCKNETDKRTLESGLLQFTSDNYPTRMQAFRNIRDVVIPKQK